MLLLTGVKSVSREVMMLVEGLSNVNWRLNMSLNASNALQPCTHHTSHCMWIPRISKGEPPVGLLVLPHPT